MNVELPNRKPQFKVGDEVVIVIPGLDRGKQGKVIQVNCGTCDFVYRYSVQFPDGTLKRYFGFEIDSGLSQIA